MRDTLPARSKLIECGIVNIDSDRGPGNHWVRYIRHRYHVTYFNAFGDLPPCIELVTYLKGCSIKYNFESEQTYNTFICGHLCVLFLLENEAEKISRKYFHDKF